MLLCTTIYHNMIRVYCYTHLYILYGTLYNYYTWDNDYGPGHLVIIFVSGKNLMTMTRLCSYHDSLIAAELHSPCNILEKKHCLLHIYLCAENFRYNICILKCMRYMPSRHSIYLVIPWISANYETTTETGDLNRQTIKWGPTTNLGIINLVFNESFCKRLSQILINCQIVSTLYLNYKLSK